MSVKNDVGNILKMSISVGNRGRSDRYAINVECDCVIECDVGAVILFCGFHLNDVGGLVLVNASELTFVDGYCQSGIFFVDRCEVLQIRFDGEVLNVVVFLFEFKSKLGSAAEQRRRH